jgi:chromosome segregation ATPase
MKNFVTYSEVTFNCGPSLNMIIGPNGTGKSTLVCAIALGLGWPPNVLGRAKEIGEYVKNGCSESTIEIELQGVDEHNILVKRKIHRLGNKSDWWLNRKTTTLKKVQETMHDLNIQVNNLCQFLPQDRVVEFSAMTPIQKLEQTERAVADPEVSAWHEELKELGDELKKQTADKEFRTNRLGELLTRQKAQEADVERMNQRRAHEFRIEVLTKFIPFFEYNSGKQRVQESKVELNQAKVEQKELHDELGPAMEMINHKKDYVKQIKSERDNLKSRIAQAKTGVTMINSQVVSFRDKIKNCDQEIEAEYAQQTKHKENVAQSKHKITVLEQRSKQSPPEFDAVAMNVKVRELDTQLEGLKSQREELKTEISQQIRIVKAKDQEMSGLKNDKEALKTRAGQLMRKLANISNDSAKAYAWLQKNQSLFESEVYGPPIITCAVKDKQAVNAVESTVRKGDFLTFTVTNTKDFQTLQHYLLSNNSNCLNLADVTIKQASRSLSSFRRPTDQSTLRSLGFDGWLLDAVEGPEPVLVMLTESSGLHRTAFTTRHQNDADFERVKQSPIQNWATKDSVYQIVTRKEYNQSSINVTNLRQARIWVDQGVDTSQESALERAILELEHDIKDVREAGNALQKKQQAIHQEMQELAESRVRSSFHYIRRVFHLHFTRATLERRKTSCKKHVASLRTLLL